MELDLDKLAEVSEGHRREEQRRRVRVHVLGVRGSTPAPGHAFAAPRRQHVVRRAGARRRARRAWCSTPAPGCAASARCSASARSGARCCSATCTGTTPRACRSRAPSTTTAPRCACASPTRTTATRAVDVLRRAMSPPHFPIGPEGLRGAWTFESLEPGEHHVGGFEVLALEIPHKGGRTFGYRVSRRALVDRLPVRPRARRRSAPGPTAGVRTTTPRWPWPPASTC